MTEKVTVLRLAIVNFISEGTQGVRLPGLFTRTVTETFYVNVFELPCCSRNFRVLGGRLGRPACPAEWLLPPSPHPNNPNSDLDPTHGSQQLTLFNGFYDTACYLPLAGFLTFDDEVEQYLFLLTSCAPGNAPATRLRGVILCAG